MLEAENIRRRPVGRSSKGSKLLSGISSLNEEYVMKSILKRLQGNEPKSRRVME